MAVDFAKFGAVGVVNTLVGYLTILAAMTWAGLAPVPANVVGYAVGLCVSFVLNRRFTFAGRGGGGIGQVLGFFAVFALSYGLNLLVLREALFLLAPAWAQALAMVSYTVCFFLLSRAFVFPETEAKVPPVFAALDTVARSPVSWAFGLIILAVLSAPLGLPHGWGGNEINYFDLGHRVMHPEKFTELHAANDDSNARLVSLGLIGIAIDLFGFEGAHTVLTFLCWAAMCLGLVYLARGLRLSPAALILGLAAYFGGRQMLIGGEWLFGGVEGKVLAYAAVFFALGLALRGRYMPAVMLAALAAYFHFLVGGFWGLALLALGRLQGRSWRDLVPPFALFVLLLLPLAGLLVQERLLAEKPDLTGLPFGPEVIYAVYRNPHHLAPYASPEWFAANWRPGLIWAGLMAMTLLMLIRIVPERRVAMSWVAGLNIYIVAAFVIAWLDRHTHALAPFYLFRPMSLTTLLTLMLGTQALIAPLPATGQRLFAAAAVAVFAVLSVPAALTAAREAFTEPDLAEELDDEERALVDWLRTETPGDAVLLFDIWPQQYVRRASVAFFGLERLTERPLMVMFKFVPTGTTGLVRWYRLIQWREEVFAGDCDAVLKEPVDYLITRELPAEGLTACTEPAWQDGSFTVLKVIRD
nr:GtrA family protein [Pseudoruegeria sp. HB172150]